MARFGLVVLAALFLYGLATGELHGLTSQFDVTGGQMMTIVMLPFICVIGFFLLRDKA